MKFKIFCCLVIIFITLFMPSYIYAYDTTLENKDYIIFIDINELSLSLLDKETKILVKKYPVAIGKKETPSPIGNWRITSKALKDGPFGEYWLGLNAPWDTFGIHGTSNPGSIGSLASNGCIRMFNENIKEVFYAVNYDTPVIIYSGPSWLFSPYARDIKPNDKGTDVYYVQRTLKYLNYYSGTVDGIYGYPLELSVRKYKEDHQMDDTPIIDKSFLDSIGLYKFE